MNERENETENRRDSLRLAGAIALLGLFAGGAAVSGVFFRPAVFLVSVPMLGVAGYSLFRLLVRGSWPLRFALLFSVTVSVILLSGTEPFLFSGRDQGAIAEASVLLARDGGLRSSSPLSDIFFRIYGPGAALHFPGFHYATDGSLVTQFPIGTVAFFGIFVSLFGISGLVIVNGCLLVLSLFFLFLVVRDLADERFGLGALLVGASSFLPLFIARLPLSENLFLALFLMLSLSLVRFLRDPSRDSLSVSLLLGASLSLVRIEGVFAFMVTLAIVIFSAAGRGYFARKRPELQLSVLVLSLLFLAASLAVNLPLYRSVVGATLDHIFTPSSDSDPSGTGIALSLWNLFLSYGLFLPFLLGLSGTVLLVFRRRWHALVPAALALPAFLFLVDPNISPDHPWMLRRFLFSLWPTFMIAFPVALFLLVGRAKRRRAARILAVAVFATVILAALPATRTLLSFHEYEGLSTQIDGLAGRIGEHDLLLLDREALGDPYAIPAAPLRLLHHRNAVYFFNPDDSAKIPTGAFEHVYLLAPVRNAETLWSKLPATLVPVAAERFVFDRLRPTPLSDPAPPIRETVKTESVLYRLDPLPAPSV